MTHRSPFLALPLAVLLASGVLSSCSDQARPAESAELTTVTMMMFQGQAYRLPILVADDQGFFAQHGIQVDLVEQPSGLTGAQSMAATKSHVSHISAATLIPGWQAGDEFPWFCGGIDVLQTSLWAAESSDLPSMTDGASWQEVLQSLEGKTVGIQTPVGSGLHLLFADALASAGVHDVTFVNVGATTTTVQAALDNNSVDAAQVNPPGTQMLQANSFGKELIYLPDGPTEYAEYWGSGLVAQPEWLEENPELAADFCDATRQAHAFIAQPENLDTSAQLLSGDTGVPLDAARLVVQNVYDDHSADLPSEDVLTTTLEAYAELGVIDGDAIPPFEELVIAGTN